MSVDFHVVCNRFDAHFLTEDPSHNVEAVRRAIRVVEKLKYKSLRHPWKGD